MKRQIIFLLKVLIILAFGVAVSLAVLSKQSPTEGISKATYDPMSGQMYVSGVLKPGATNYFSAATSSSGNLVFYITTDGTNSGTAVCSNFYTPTLMVWPTASASILYNYGTPTISGDKKTITVAVTQSNSLLLGVLNFVTASNGITFNMHVTCD